MSTPITAHRRAERRGEQRAPDALHGRVVVGVDGTPASVAALAWALRTALASGAELDVVTAWPDPGDVFVHEIPGHYCVPRGRAQEAQEAALVATGAGDTRVPALRTHLDNSHPVNALVEHADGAGVLVVGASHPHEGSRHLPVDRLCVLLAECPVVVVEETDESDESEQPDERQGAPS